ncbi:MAG: uroporphyrinogen decarboxylase family protein [Candidatus Helarchaeota archaeon]
MNLSKDRVLKTLNHEEPDRVPIFISSIDSEKVLRPLIENGKTLGSIGDYLKKMHYLLGWRKIVKWLSHQKFVLKAGFKQIIGVYKDLGIDLFATPVVLFITGSGRFGIKLIDDEKNYLNFVDEYGRIFKFIKTPDDLQLLYYVGGYFASNDLNESMEKYEKFKEKLDPDHPIRTRSYKSALELGKDDLYVIPAIAGVLEPVWESFGFDTFVKLIFKEKKFMKKVFRDLGEFSVNVVNNICENVGAELFWMWDDQAHKTGTFLTPNQFKEFVLPELKRICEACHKNGAKIIMHTDGNIEKIISDLVNEAKVDGLNPFEPGASMDIIDAKKKWGDKIALVGNVDPIEYLAHGTPELVEARVKELIKNCAPGGGYIISSGHSINPSVSYENFMAMINTAKKYGKYPINL